HSVVGPDGRRRLPRDGLRAAHRAGAYERPVPHPEGVRLGGRRPARRVRPSDEALSPLASLRRVQDLRVQFLVPGGTLNAVDGISFDVDRGEIVGIVGESGSGKTMTALSLLRLIPEPGKITSGKILYGEQDVVQMSDEEIR